MEEFLAKNSDYVRDGKKKVKIRGKTGLKEYERQRVSRKRRGKKKIRIPTQEFFGKVRPGIGVVSENLEREAIEQILEKSYRQTERDMKKGLGRETIRNRVFFYGKKAEEIENLQKEEKEIKSERLRNPNTTEENYKTSKGGIFKKGKEYIQKKIDQLFRRYIMADGVHVYTNEGKWRECKVGVVLKQEGEKIYEEGTFCTWERLPTFRKMLEWLLLKVFSLQYEMIIISDGAKWIRNMRKKIDCIKNTKVIWILDWFHLKEYALTLIRIFDLEEKDKKAEEIITALWRGKRNEAIKKAKSIPLSEDDDLKEKQESALKTFTTYITNQKEGIINYEAYKQEGYDKFKH